MRRVHTAVRCAGLTWLAIACVAALAPVAAAPEGYLTLSEALRVAQSCGPAFRELARLQQARLLAVQAEEIRWLPALRLAAGVRLTPGLSGGAVATLDWQVNENLSLGIQLPAGSPTPAGAAHPNIALNWAKVLWPSPDSRLAGEIETYEGRVAALEESDAFFEAVRDVIEAFHTARITAARAELARRAAAMAAARAEDALARYEQGYIGLRALQDEQNAAQQAQAALHRALTESDRAAGRFARLLGEGGCPDVESPHGALNDDLPWESFVQAFEESLGGYTPNATPDPHRVEDTLWFAAWTESLLTHSLSYVRAHLGELTGLASVAAAARHGQPSVQLSAYAGNTTTAADVAWSVSLQVTWDLTPRAALERVQAQQDLEALQDRLQAARFSALDAGRNAWLAVTESLQALERARGALETARRTEEIVLRRVAAGLAPVAEAEEARLEVERRLLDVSEAEVALRLGWLQLAQSLGWAWQDVLLPP